MPAYPQSTFCTSPKMHVLNRITHGFFTRANGDASIQIQTSEGIAPIAHTLDIQPGYLLSARQVHGIHVITVEQPWRFQNRPEADAMVCRVPGFGLGILTADCAPILFAEPHQHIIGAAHAGWKGALAGIVEATISAMEQLGARRDSIIACIGPTIAQNSYEVDQAFYECFLQKDQNNSLFFTLRPTSTKWNFDLPAYIQQQLHDAHIQHIDRVNHDTYDNEACFFSYRRSSHRQESGFGRQLSVIALKAT